jgi:hypothetical protein
MRLLAALALVLTAASAEAQSTFYQDGRPAPDDGGSARRDGFGAVLLITPDREAFEQAWAGPTPPNLVTTDRAQRGQPVFAMLLFTGCLAGSDGNCDVTAEFAILKPDGSTYDSPVQAPVWGAQPAPGDNLQLSRASLGLRIEPGDPMGTYTIQVTVTDRHRRVAIVVHRPVIVDSPPLPITS